MDIVEPLYHACYGKKERPQAHYREEVRAVDYKRVCGYCQYRRYRVDGKDYVHLDLTHLDREVLDKKLPDITDFVQTYLGIDPHRQPIPIQPTAHYAMGGIPTTIDAEVIRDAGSQAVPGLYAAGECACVSVHGANRLGTNSLVDIIVFGSRGGRRVAEWAAKADPPSLEPDAEGPAHEMLDRFTMNLGGEDSRGAAAGDDGLRLGVSDAGRVERGVGGDHPASDAPAPGGPSGQKRAV